MPEEFTTIRPRDGVALYTGLGQAPFGPEHEVELPTAHAETLIQANHVTRLAEPAAHDDA